MVIPKFIKAALLNQPIIIYGSGKQTRCFADILDVVWALKKLMNEPKAIGKAFNIGNTEEISIESLAYKIKDLVNSNSKIEYIEYDKAFEEGFEDMQMRMPDLKKINDLIGYEPKYNLDTILERVIKYHEK
jgi:UDP-glucose 4-epimerase